MTNRYLLNKWRVERLDQARCSDVTYLPTRRWVLYLVATMDGEPIKQTLPHTAANDGFPPFV